MGPADTGHSGADGLVPGQELREYKRVVSAAVSAGRLLTAIEVARLRAAADRREGRPDRWLFRPAGTRPPADAVTVRPQSLRWGACFLPGLWLVAVTATAAVDEFVPPVSWRPAPELGAGFPGGALRALIHERPVGTAPARRVVAVLWDPRSPAVALRPVLAPTTRTVSQFAAQEPRRVFAALNGGFFGGNQSFSLVVAAGQVLAPNVRQLSRPLQGVNTNYFPTRAAWGLDVAGRPAAHWVYSVGAGPGVLTAYEEPSPNRLNTPPAPVPGAEFPAGARPWPAAQAIGGSPMLVRDGVVRVTDAEELIEVNNSSRRPRSAIGHLASGLVALVAAEGDQPGGPPGLTLLELAELLRDFGCVAAINLDGGGSTMLLSGGAPAVRPGDGAERPVVSALLLTESAGSGPVQGPPVLRQEPWALRLAPGGAGWLQAGAEGGGLAYQWSRDGERIAGATTASLRVEAAAAEASGRYAVTVSNARGVVTSAAVPVTVGPGAPGELVNLSVRAAAGAGEDQLVAGLAVRGAPVRLLARAVGPGLEPFGVLGALADPALELRAAGGVLLAANDDWPSDLTATAASAGAFPLALGSRDAGLVAAVEPGTFLLSCPLPTGALPGEALLEVYALNANAGALANLSTRARLAPRGALTAGFVVRGDQALTILVRAVGPSLLAFGVGEAVAAPRLILGGAAGVLAVNEGWASAPNAEALRSAAARAGAFPLSGMAADAALLVTLPPGAYTAALAPSGGSGGVGLIEVYEVR